MLLWIKPHRERRNIDYLPSKPDMPLSGKHSGMVDRFSHVRLEYKSLKATLKGVLHRQGQNMIKLALALVQKPMLIHPVKKSLTLKIRRGFFSSKGQEILNSISDAAQSIPSPLVLSHQLQLCIHRSFS